MAHQLAVRLGLGLTTAPRRLKRNAPRLAITAGRGAFSSSVGYPRRMRPMCDSDNPVTTASTYAVCPCERASRIAPYKAARASSNTTLASR